MKKIFYSPYVILVFGFVLIQQLIVASSTLWIAKLFTAVADRAEYLSYLFLFLGSLIIPYLPAYFSILMLTKWKQDVFGNLIDEFATKNYGVPINWANSNLKSIRLPFFCNEAFPVVRELLFFLFDSISLILNILFNIIMIGFVIDGRFLFAYLFCVGIAILSAMLSKKPISKASEQAQISRIDLGDTLLKSWDNVILSNKYNYKIWRGITQRKYEESAKNDIHLTNISSSIAELTSAISVLPVFSVLLYIVFTHRFDFVFLAVLFSSLPRQLMILNHLYALTTNSSKFHQVSAQVKGLAKILTPTQPEKIDDRISWSKLVFFNQNTLFKCNSIDDLKKETANFQSGHRWTIRGENGSGKSTMLLLIKSLFVDEAFYLPGKSDLQFSKNLAQRSTGQTMIAALQELFLNVNCKLILLDEWDANLDETNIFEINKVLEKIKDRFCLIEVRHRA